LAAALNSPQVARIVNAFMTVKGAGNAVAGSEPQRHGDAEKDEQGKHEGSKPGFLQKEPKRTQL
jgi:hypothetical protein